jgi:hypothetical protein
MHRTNQQVIVHVNITSPGKGQKRFVGPNRGVAVSVEAWATVHDRPDHGRGRGDGRGRGHIPEPLAEPGLPQPTGGPQLMGGPGLEIDQVQVHLGDGPWRHARQDEKPGRQWRGTTGTVDSDGEYTIMAKAVVCANTH